MEFKPECRRCHTLMKPGYLINDPDVQDGDGVIRAGGSGASFQSAPIKVTGCWKCPACGHSFVPRVPVPQS